MTRTYATTGSGSSANYADNETPSGTFNSSNVTFNLAHSPSPTGSLQLFLNGQFLSQTTDYTLSGSVITFTTAPSSLFATLPFRAFYRY